MDINLCIICNQSVCNDSFGKVIKKPRIQGLKGIFDAADKRKDNVSVRIEHNRNLLESLKHNFRYHQECYKKYTSPQDIAHYQLTTSTSKIHSATKERPKTSFDIRKMCFICNKQGTLKKKKLISVSTGTGEATRSKVLKAAECRKDIEMIGKLSMYPDLFAMDAKYHQACYSHYISSRNLKYCSKSNLPNKAEHQHLAGTAIHTTSSSIEEPNSIKEESDLLVLHKAANIIRKALSNQNASSSSYPSQESISLENCKNEVPMELLYLISWILNEEDYNSATISDTGDISILATCNVLMVNYNKTTNINKNYSILSLCLGLQVYYTTRSKKNIEILYKMGYSCSYDEIRTFLTNFANTNLQRSSDLYIPESLKEVTHDNFIRASIDNFDINEETIDGKNSTHSMAAVVFQTKSDCVNFETITRLKSRALSSENDNTHIVHLKVYEKTMNRPEPPRMNESYLSKFHDNPQDIRFSDEDLVWNIGRFLKATSLNWSDYNNIHSKNKVPVSTIQYLPFINASPTNYDTILTSLVNLSKLAEALKQDHIVVTADLAIYSKAQEILWSNPSGLQEKITMQIGGMHLLMAYIASLGTIFGDGGLKKLLVESDVFAENTCNQILQGKQYSRGIRALTLAGDALTRLFLQELMKWSEYNYKNQLISVELRKLLEHIDLHTFEGIGNKIENIKVMIDRFTDYGTKRSSTFKYWMMFLNGVNLLWQYLRAERNGEFENHLLAVSKMIPYLRAAGRHNYAKYVPVYLSDMTNLKLKQPKMYEFLNSGNFVVKKSDEKRFNCVASDMALEQSINRDCKSYGGVIGFTQKPQTLLRWLVTRHCIGDYITKFEKLFSQNKSCERHQCSTAQVRDENDVSQILHLFKEQWTNPFDLLSTPNNLVNITTGWIAPKDIEDSLTTCIVTAKTNHDQFVRKTFFSEHSFWKPIKREKTKTFSDHLKKQNESSENRLAAIGSEAMFRRVLTVAHLKDYDMSKVMAFELTSVPLSLFHEDFTMRKNVKSDLKSRLENHSSVSYHSPDNIDAIIIDGMAMIQEIRETKRTFNELGEMLIKKIITLLKISKSVTLVFDRYDRDISLKGVERRRRGENIESTFLIRGDRCIPKYREFLKSSLNKHNLVLFLSEYLCIQLKNSLYGDSKVVIAGGFQDGEECRTIRRASVVQNLQMKCNHEEADTRLVLHLLEQLKTDKAVLIRSDDTDVLVLLIYFAAVHIEALQEKEIYIQTGHSNETTNKLRFININSIVQKLGKEFCSFLPALHALTGSDTTNSFFKIGKKTAFDIAWKKKENITSLKHFHLSTVGNAVDIARNFILMLYKGDGAKTLNELRHRMTLNTSKSSAEIPPTENTFLHHVKRCLLQCKLWCSSHIAIMDELDIFQYGWENVGQFIRPTNSSQKPIPDELRELLNISCKDRNCVTKKCECFKENLKCTDACKCKGCNNHPTPEILNEEDVEDQIEDVEDQIEDVFFSV